MAEVSYASAANDEKVRPVVTPELKDAKKDVANRHTMDVTALMTMLDKNRGQQKEAEKTLFALEEASTPVQVAAQVDVLGKPRRKPAARSGAMPETAKKKAAAKKAVAPKATVKEPAQEPAKAEARPKLAEVQSAAANAPAEELPVPASVAVSRLQVERNSKKHPREVQVQTQTNSRRISPHADGIAPVEYAAVATLMAVAVAVLVAIFYLVNDKGDIEPVVSTLKLNQTVVRENEMAPANAPIASRTENNTGNNTDENVTSAVPLQGNTGAKEAVETVEEELLSIIRR